MISRRIATLATALAATVPALLAAQAEAPVTIVPVPATALTLPRTHAPRPTTAAISAADLMTRLYIVADDSMMGREAGTEGNVKATTYIAGEAKHLGLQPAGDNGTYFQTLPFKTRTIDSTSALTFGGTAVGWGTQWAGRANASFPKADLAVVYGGASGDSTVHLEDAQVAGKLVIVQLVMAPGRGPRIDARAFPSAAAIAVVAPAQFLGFITRPTTFVDDPAKPASPAAVRPLVLITAEGAQQAFDTPLAQLTPGATGKPATLELRVSVEPVPFPARNVVGIIPGSDPKLKGQYVAIGAHNDHVGVNNRPVDHDSLRIFNHIVQPGGAENRGNQASPEQQAQVNTLLADWRAKHPGTQRIDSIANGADDDGSGTVSVLEIAEHFAMAKQKPKRSLLFVWHVGEEKGLLGSAWFTDHPTVPLDSVVAQLNMDMVGRGDAWDVSGMSKDGEILRGNSNYLQVVGSRRLSTELGDLIESVNTSGKHGIVFDYGMDANGHPMNIYCRSDHYEYARYGVPIAFFTTGGHSDYHQVTDEPEYIDYPHMERVDKLVADIAAHVANLDHRIVVDHEKPDPHGECVQ